MSASSTPQGRIAGTVKWFNDIKGYGFIEVGGGEPDVFVHYSGISGKGHRTLQDNDPVEFEITIVPSEKGERRQAVNVVKRSANAANAA